SSAPKGATGDVMRRGGRPTIEPTEDKRALMQSLDTCAGAQATPTPAALSRWRALGLLTVAVLLVLSMWFSASAVAPTLIRQWHISGLTVIWLTASVQIGFVTGALLSASFALPDLLSSRKLFVASCLFGAACNALFVVAGQVIPLALLLRF